MNKERYDYYVLDVKLWQHPCVIKWELPAQSIIVKQTNESWRCGGAIAYTQIAGVSLDEVAILITKP
jgi:hypothetical protein